MTVAVVVADRSITNPIQFGSRSVAATLAFMTMVLYSLTTDTASPYIYITVLDVWASFCFARQDYPLQRRFIVPLTLHVLVSAVHQYNLGYYYLHLRSNTAMLLLLGNQLTRTWSIFA
jgi:hypothetical protein